MRHAKRYPVLLLVLLLIGCGQPTTTPPHPNAINAFDGWAYDRLTEIQAGLNQAKIEVAKFPQFKEQVNQAGAAYNVARAVYATYHTAGVPDPQAEQKLSAQIQDLSVQVANLLRAFGVGP